MFFKIRPDKSVSELIIPYKDLKDNFPFALIEYYETKINIKNNPSTNLEEIILESEKNTGILKSITRNEKKQK